MWWTDIRDLHRRLALHFEGNQPGIHSEASIDSSAILDERAGPVWIGAGTVICGGAVLRGPIVIGENCTIGNLAMLRGPLAIGHNAKVGFATEVKQALIGDGVSIGPQCFVADSKVDRGAYLGAQVRTSNQRLDQTPIRVFRDGVPIETGLDKLGCWIGEGASLGIQVIILPGREIAAGSVFEPRITVTHNHPKGHYRAEQTVVKVA